MELFDKDGKAIELDAVKQAHGFKTQADIDGAVGSAVERAKRTHGEKLSSELEAKYSEQINNLQSQLDAAKKAGGKAAEKDEYMAAMERKMAQLEERDKKREEELAKRDRMARKAELKSNITAAIAGKFSDDEAVELLIENKHVKSHDDGSFFFTDSLGAEVDLPSLVDKIMAERPGLVKADINSGVGGRESQPIKKEYNSLSELNADREKFVIAGKQHEYQEIRNSILEKKAQGAKPNIGVATLGV